MRRLAARRNPMMMMTRVTGIESMVFTPQRAAGEAVRYEVIDASDLIPSHTHSGFSPHPSYPAGVQERDYLANGEEQLKVIAGSGRLNPALILSDTPSPLDGPPLVTGGEKRLVLGGNGRSMMMLRAFDDEAIVTAYRAALLQRAAAFGLDADQVAAIRCPVLVRTVLGLDDVSSLADLGAAVRRFNEGLTQQLSPLARAVAEAKTLTPETIEAIGDLLVRAQATPHPSGSEWSLRHIMADKVLGARSASLMEILRRDGVINAQNQSQWIRGGEFTPEAKDRIEGMFLGRVMGSERRLTDTAASVLAKIERIVPYMLRVAGVNPSLEEVELLRQAVDTLNEASSRGMGLEDHLSQASMFGSPRERASEDLARLLCKDAQKTFSARFRAWSSHAAVDPRQARLFNEPPTRASARAVLFSKHVVAA
jgi:hypothetical protein